MSAPRITESAGAVRFSVHLQPGATRDEVGGLHGDAIKVRVRARPVDGAANAALIDLLASALGVPRRAVRIVAGLTSRTKVIEATGADRGRVARLAGG